MAETRLVAGQQPAGRGDVIHAPLHPRRVPAPANGHRDRVNVRDWVFVADFDRLMPLAARGAAGAMNGSQRIQTARDPSRPTRRLHACDECLLRSRCLRGSTSAGAFHDGAASSRSRAGGSIWGLGGLPSLATSFSDGGRPHAAIAPVGTSAARMPFGYSSPSISSATLVISVWSSPPDSSSCVVKRFSPWR
jgi:hypothetical protein